MTQLTLIVATFGRRQELLNFLASVNAAQAAKVRILIVDQNEEAFLEEELAKLCAHPSVTLVRVPFRSASLARNYGARLAETQWIGFPDDDCTLLPTTLSTVLHWIDTPGLDLVTGQVVDERGRPHLIDWLPHDADVTPQTLDHTFVESAFFIRRETFLAVGGFDPVFGPGAEFASAEGADLMRRLWRREPGLKARFTPSIELYHPHKEQAWTEETRGRIYRFARGEGALTARHWRVLPLRAIARRILLRVAGSCIATGEKRRRKTAYLKGFYEGVMAYRRGGYRWQDGRGEEKQACTNP